MFLHSYNSVNLVDNLFCVHNIHTIKSQILYPVLDEIHNYIAFYILQVHRI